MPRYKIWKLKKYDMGLAVSLANALQVSPVITGILLNRGLKDEEEMRQFLFGNPQVYHEPLLMKDMQKAGERILEAIRRQEPITVYGDYDVDGITASSLLYLFLKDQGARVNTYIPKRKGEGYGLNTEAVHNLAQEGTRLLVTVDCGISGINEVAEAPAGMDIIITDHHMPPDTLPPAYAIINPKQPGCGYPFKGLSGVGVAFKLCQALYQMQNLRQPLWEKYTELAALGTVADIVPLQGENRELVKRGLKALETTPLIGLQKLMEVSGCPKKDVSSENIGFIIAPRLNAVGRLEHAQLAVELLTTGVETEAQSIAEELNKENILRQEISRQIFIEAEAMLAQQKEVKTAIVLAREGWHAGVIGIVASRLVDKYNLPTILISIDGENAKGSCRSIASLDLYSAISECSDCLIQFGGHHQAAGLTLRAARVGEFKQRFMNVVAGRLSPSDYEPKLTVDVLLDGTEKLTLPLLKQLQRLEPFGCENPVPVFALQKAAVHNPKVFGKEDDHLRFFVEYGGEHYHSIMWNGSHYHACLYNNACTDLAFMPKINVYQGMESINLQVLSFDQELTVFDYRHELAGKEERFKKVVQTQKNIAVFFNKGSKPPDFCQAYPQVGVLTYGEAVTPEVDIVIFYDLPDVSVFTRETFPLSKQPGKTLLLLYNHEDYRQAHRDNEINYPDRNHLSLVYRFVSHYLKIHILADLAEIQAAAAAGNIMVTEQDIVIFTELGFLHNENKRLGMGEVHKQELNNSPTFVKLREQGKKQQEIFEENYKIILNAINEVWRGEGGRC